MVCRSIAVWGRAARALLWNWKRKRKRRWTWMWDVVTHSTNKRGRERDRRFGWSRHHTQGAHPPLFPYIILFLGGGVVVMLVGEGSGCKGDGITGVIFVVGGDVVSCGNSSRGDIRRLSMGGEEGAVGPGGWSRGVELQSRRGRRWCGATPKTAGCNRSCRFVMCVDE